LKLITKIKQQTPLAFLSEMLTSQLENKVEVL